MSTNVTTYASQYLFDEWDRILLAERVATFVLFKVENGYAYFTDGSMDRYSEGRLSITPEKRPAVARLRVDDVIMTAFSRNDPPLHLLIGITTLDQAMAEIDRLVRKLPRPIKDVDVFEAAPPDGKEA